MKKVIALAVKDLKVLLRDKAGFFFTFFFPLLIAVFFGTIFSGDNSSGGSISLLLVDHDNSENSRKFVAALDSADELNIRRMSKRQEAMDLVRRGSSTAFVLLKPGFGESQDNVFWGGPPGIELGVDPARKAEAGMLKGILTKYAVENLQNFFSDNAAMRKNAREAIAAIDDDTEMPENFRNSLKSFLGELDGLLEAEESENVNSKNGEGFAGLEPLKIEETSITVQRSGPNNSYAVSFPQGIIWGILGSTIGFGVSIVMERTRGTLVRLRMAPISRWQILAGKGLACFIMTLIVSITLMAIGVSIFGVRPDSYSLLLLAFVSTSVAFVGIMMLLSVLGRTEQAVSGFSWAVMMVMAMFGGAMIPIFIMPSWMQTLSNFSPIKWAILSIEGAIWREFTLNEMLLPASILFSVGAVLFFFGSKVFQWLE